MDEATVTSGEAQRAHLRDRPRLRLTSLVPVDTALDLVSVRLSYARSGFSLSPALSVRNEINERDNGTALSVPRVFIACDMVCGCVSSIFSVNFLRVCLSLPRLVKTRLSPAGGDQPRMALSSPGRRSGCYVTMSGFRFPVVFRFVLKQLTDPWCGLVSKTQNANTENI